jgi:hypothetical protein
MPDHRQLDRFLRARNAKRSAMAAADGFVAGKRIYSLRLAAREEVEAATAIFDWIEEQVRAELGLLQQTRKMTVHNVSAREIREMNGYLANCTDRQVEGVYHKEREAGRDAYAELALAEGRKRNLEFALTAGFEPED